ncbi:MAG: putative transport system permease protein [Acidobacteriaceae bacterium]|nr:putative transport system permease protein [Acidobacteriaceae bacterium]
MNLIRILLTRCSTLFHRGGLDKELDEELRTHIDLAVKEHLQKGMSEQNARTAALRDFGGVSQIREGLRIQRGLPLLEVLLQDVSFGLRQLRRSPGHTAVCLLTLCLGIGVNAAIFSVIQAVILRPLPYEDPDRLVHLTDPQDSVDGGILYKDFESLKSQNRSFVEMSAYYRDSGWSRVELTDSQEPEAVQGAFVSTGFFSVLGKSPILGRVFTTQEESRHERVVILSYSVWRRRFGGSPDVVGQTVRVDGTLSQVIGVMPETFQFPARDSLFWAPITTNRYWGDPAANSNDGQHSRGFYARWQAIGRLKRDRTAQQAQAEVDALFSGLNQTDPDASRGIGIKASPLQVEVSGNTRLALYVLFASVCLLLLIACANVANLLLAQAFSRTHEMALRAALGASPGRIFQQSLTETCLLAGFSGLLSLPVAYLGIRALIVLGPPEIPRLQETALNLGMLGFTFAIVLLCAVFLGLVPSLGSRRTDLAKKMNSRSSAASRSERLTSMRRVLIVAEVALSVVLLTGAGLLIHSFLIVKAVDPGFDSEHVMTINVSLSGGSSGWPSSLFDSIIATIQTVPGVNNTGAIDSFFDLGPTGNLGLRSVESHLPEPREQWTALTWDTVRGNYFQTIGAQLLRGRYFLDQDGPQSPLVAIIDESAAHRYWPGENAVGKRFKGQDRRGRNDDWLTVIGVVRDIRTHGLERQPTAHIYEWYRQSGNATPDLVARASGDTAAIAATIRRAIRKAAPAVILSNITSVDQQLSHQLAPRRFQSSLLGLFSLLALLLTSVGIYGLIHYSVAQRTREIGIRMALGARRSRIVEMVLHESLVLVSIGLVGGLILDWLTTRVLSKLLFGVKPYDSFTLGAVSSLLFAIALVAGWLPARKAASIDPIVALRGE